MKNYFDFESPFILHILVYYDRSEKVWCAHCLDFNLVEDGRNLEEAEKRLASVVKSYLKEAKLRKLKKDEVYAPAPQFFWDLIMKSQKIKVRRESKKFLIPYLSFRSPPVDATAPVH